MLKSFKIFRLSPLSSIAMPLYYAVIGPKAGIFDTWDKAKECTHGVSRSRCKKFNTLKEAENYLADHNHEFYTDTIDPAEKTHESRLASKILSNNDCDFSKPVAVKKRFEAKDPERSYYDEIAKKLDRLNKRQKEKQSSSFQAQPRCSFSSEASDSNAKRSRSPSASLGCENSNKPKKRRIVVDVISSDSDDESPPANSKKISALPKNCPETEEIIAISDSDSEPADQSCDTNGDLWGDEDIFEAVPEHLLTEGPSQSCSSKPENPTSSHRSGMDFSYDSKGYVIVYTDGACSNNGHKGAQAGIGVWFNHNHPLNVAEPVEGSATNNNAEIQAATRAMQQAMKAGVRKLNINTDSQFVIQCMTQWIHKWKENGWKLSTGGPVKNKEKLAELDKTMKSLASVIWTFVQSHVGIEGNEAADALARQGAQMYQANAPNRNRKR